MPIATAPALLIGLGARILLDYFSRSDGPVVKDFLLAGVWQGVALHYATKTSNSSGFGIIVAFGIAAKLFIEFNLVSDVTRCVTTILGVALGVLFTDFLSQYFDKPQQSSDRRRKQTQATKPRKRHERVVQFRPSVQGGSVETLADITDVGTLATTSHLFSDITSVDSGSDRVGPSSSLSALEREIHVLRTRASLADSERRRFKEERKWATSQGNVARASQMKWEVKRYTSLMQTFTREADLKALEVANMNSNGNGHRQPDPVDHIPVVPSSKAKATKPSREVPLKGNGSPTNGHASHKLTHQKRPSNAKPTTRDANG
ncbi:hypothetical protein GALMADRAFT_535174 [Galerina marginata CBS 339.88]|uniref:Uncharacterized protein n=1 Tax=Galerina marginata (strain CBS 339.88) TaxID=685588 RepID=A0A067SWC7_GALM3|nr:hypothetical protein GALMADRAFT_535174 [Galerina marginata CBS 339.88]